MAISPITKVFRACVRDRKLLHLNNEGNVVKLSPGSDGRTARNEMKDPLCILTNSQIKQHIKTNFPNYPITNVEDPTHRALDIKRRSGLSYFTQKVADEAARAFLVPAGQRATLTWPEMMDRAILQKDEKHWVRRACTCIASG